MISLVRTVISPSRQSVTPRHQVMLVRSCQSRTNSPTYTPLLEVVRQRRAQARRSILCMMTGSANIPGAAIEMREATTFEIPSTAQARE